MYKTGRNYSKIRYYIWDYWALQGTLLIMYLGRRVEISLVPQLHRIQTAQIALNYNPQTEGNSCCEGPLNNNNEHSEHEQSMYRCNTDSSKPLSKENSCYDSSLESKIEHSEDEHSKWGRTGITTIKRKPKRRLDLLESSGLSDLSETVDRVSGRRCDNRHNVQDLKEL